MPQKRVFLTVDDVTACRVRTEYVLNEVVVKLDESGIDVDQEVSGWQMFIGWTTSTSLAYLRLV